MLKDRSCKVEAASWKLKAKMFRKCSKIDQTCCQNRLRMALGDDWGLLGRALGDIPQSESRDCRKTGANFSIWVGFGRLLGVAWGSKNLAFSYERCSKSDWASWMQTLF